MVGCCNIKTVIHPDTTPCSMMLSPLVDNDVPEGLSSLWQCMKSTYPDQKGKTNVASKRQLDAINWKKNTK